MFHKSVVLSVLIVGFAIMPLAAHADAYADLGKAKAAFDATHSWHAVEQMSNGHTVTMDHVAPDRWRIQVMPGMTEIMIGSDMYMVRNGQTMHLPMVMPQIQQMVNQNWLTVTPEVKRTLRDLGMQKVNGAAVHAYSYTANGDPVTLYLGRNHLPVQSVVHVTGGTVTITYSQYNTAITINP
ncbi:MAG: hypothetical protein ACYDCJ_01495 [Gammaproteobacteria bacterium]